MLLMMMMMMTYGIQCPVHTTNTYYKTVLSCVVRVGGMNKIIGDKSRLSVTENFETVLSSLEMRCEQNFLASTRFPICNQDLFPNVFTPQTRLDKTVQSPILLRTTENSLYFSSNSVHTTDKTRQDSLVSFVVAMCRF